MVEQATNDRSETSRETASRPLVRREVALCALAVLALSVGYYGGQFIRSRWIAVPVTEVTAVDEQEVPSEAADRPEPTPLLDIDPDSPVPATAKALIEETRSNIEKLVAGFPNNPDMLEMKARTQVWLGKSNEAWETWQRCLQIDPNYVHAYVGMASAAAERSEHERAAELAQKAIDLAPQNFPARDILAEALLQLGRAKEVPAIFEEFLKQDPRSRGFHLLGQAYAQMKEYDKARENYESAIRLYPEYGEAYNGLAVAYARLGDSAKAKEAREKFQEVSSPEKRAEGIRGVKVSDLTVMLREASVLYTDAGRVCYVNQHQRDAETLWLRAAVLDPENPDCRQSMAWLCRNANRPGENIDWLEQLADLDPENTTYWMEIGRIYDDLMILPAAEASFRKVIEIAPESDIGYAAVADLLLRYDKNLDEAKQFAEKAVDIQPNAANYAVLAVACRSTDDLPACRLAIDQAIVLAPRNPVYRVIRDSLPK